MPVYRPHRRVKNITKTVQDEPRFPFNAWLFNVADALIILQGVLTGKFPVCERSVKAQVVYSGALSHLDLDFLGV